MAKVNSVIDTVLGEAKAGDFNDMLGIVSVIDNRSVQLGVSHMDVVSGKNQFDAFGKALPPGVDAYRDMAQKAIDQVKAFGPVHNATFYSTPATVQNLPDKLTKVTETAGHQYFADPLGRAINTAKGYKTPDLGAVQVARASLPDIGPTPTARPEDIAPTAIGYAPEAVTEQDPFGAVLSAPDRAPGLAGLSPTFNESLKGQPSSPDPGLFDFSPRSAKTRNMDVNTELTGKVQEAISRMGPDYGWATSSGGQLSINDPNAITEGVDVPYGDPRANRTGSVRHDLGRAIDGSITRNGVALDPVNNRQDYMNALTNLAEAGVGGLGHYGWGVHADLGSPNTWGPTRSRNSLDPGFGLAIQQGRALSSLDGNYPTPTANPRSVSTAPVSPVERATLADAVPSAPTLDRDFSVPSGAMTNIETASLQAPDFSSARLTSPNNISGPISAPSFDQAAFNATTPDISMPDALPDFSPVTKATAPDDLDVAAMVDQYGQYRSPTTPQALIDIEDRPKPTVAAVPSVPAVAKPAMAVLSRPTGAVSAPVAPSRAATGMDVWGGKATTGIATNGNQMTRNPDGSVTMTSSRYGYQETMNPDGSFRSTTAPGVFGLDAAARNAFGGIGASRSAPDNVEKGGFQSRFNAMTPDISMPGQKALGAPNIGQQIGKAVGTAAGTAALGAPGGILGGIIGGMFGNALGGGAQSQQGGGFFSGIGNALGSLFGGGDDSGSSSKSSGGKSSGGKSGKSDGGMAASFGGGESR